MVEFAYILASGTIFTIGLLGDVITTLWRFRSPEISSKYHFQRWFIERGLYTMGHVVLLATGLVFLYMFRNELIVIAGLALLGLGLLLPTYTNLKDIRVSKQSDQAMHVQSVA